MEINEKISAVVTGGASGLGEATARTLSSMGANVAIFDLDENKGLAVSEEINSDFYKVDVTDTNSVNQAVLSFLKKNDGIQIVVNCAGIGPAAKTVSRGEPHSSELFAKGENPAQLTASGFDPVLKPATCRRPDLIASTCAALDSTGKKTTFLSVASSRCVTKGFQTLA